MSSAEIKVSWKELIDCGRWIICNKLPLNGVVWYPGGSMKSSRLHHNICCILFHWIPAILIDCLLFCLRYPPVWVTMHEKHNFFFLLLLHLISSAFAPNIFRSFATIIGQLIKCWRFSIISGYAVFSDASKKVSMCSNIMPTTNGILTTAMYSICAR